MRPIKASRSPWILQRCTMMILLVRNSRRLSLRVVQLCRHRRSPHQELQRHQRSLYQELQRCAYTTVTGTAQHMPQISSPLLASLVPLCRSCGVPLQTKDKNGPGFYALPTSVQRDKRQEDKAFDKYTANMDAADVALLTNVIPSADTPERLSDAAPTTFTDYKKIKREKDRGGATESMRLEKVISTQQECVRCRDALYRSSFEAPQFTQWLVNQVMDLIPAGLNILLVVSALDFPMGIDDRILALRHTSQHNIIVIVNKADKWFQNIQLAQKYGETFCRDYMRAKYNIAPENVHLVSGLKGWSMDKLMRAIPNDLYVIGSVNSGKLTILNALLYKCFLAASRKRHTGRDLVREQKRQDTAVQQMALRPTDAVKWSDTAKAKSRAASIFRDKVGPGTLYFPGFTRGHIALDLDGTTVYDVPGFARFDLPETAPLGLFSAVQHPRVLKQIQAGTDVYKRGAYNSKYDTVKPGQCISFGGLAYIDMPHTENLMYQIRNCINHDYAVFSSLAKALKVSIKLHANPSIGKKFLVNHTEQLLKAFTRHVIPPFYGSIDLVIHQMGHVNIKPMGPFSLKHLHERIVVYLPPGVHAIARIPVTNYIAKTFTKRDNKGNVLRKENIPTKSTFALQRYAGKHPYYTRLMPTDNEYLVEAMTSDSPDLEAEAERDGERLKKWLKIARNDSVDINQLDLSTDRDRMSFWIE